MNKLISTTSSIVLLIILMNISSASPASLLDNASNAITNFCIRNDDCAKSFFSFNNYCCKAQCCDWFSYVFNGE